MFTCRPLAVIAAIVFGVPLVSAQMPRPRMPIPISIYQDAETGVRFQYPVVWKQVSDGSDYLAPSVLKPGEHAKVIVAFSPKGNLYEKTNLSGLTFTFLAPVVHSRSECMDRVRKDPSIQHSSRQTIHGITYLHGSGGDAAMCHQQSAEVYATYRSGSCFVFEKDFNTSCAFPDQGRRELTQSEREALQRHLDAIMEIVSFQPK
jgi:hypothetical protein